MLDVRVVKRIQHHPTILDFSARKEIMVDFLSFFFSSLIIASRRYYNINLDVIICILSLDKVSYNIITIITNKFLLSLLILIFCVSAFDSNKRCRQLRDMVSAAGFNPRTVFELLLNTAQFELRLKEVLNIKQDGICFKLVRKY